MLEVCAVFASLVVSFMTSNMLELKMFYYLIHTTNYFINTWYLCIIFIFWNFISKRYRMFCNSSTAADMSFTSVPHMFVFSVLIWGIIQLFSSLFEVIIVIYLQTNFNYCNSAERNSKIISYLPIIFVLKLLFSLLGFVVFRKILQLGWCGVIVEKK
jgi:hypothetical protein